MSESITTRLKAVPVIPLIQAEDPETAVQVAKALVAGGLTVLEVVLRTPAALQCLGEIVREVPEAIVGAGTVLGESQAGAVVDAGAQFIVSPGLYEPVVRVAQSAGLPVFPGVMTASEVQAAWNLGLRTLKFFPASLAGGTAMLKALGSVFQGVSFIPTGGVSAANLPEFLGIAQVLACGGSWLTPKSAIAEGDFNSITALATEAVAIARQVRA